ncbi:von Willebrand factor A domain-containing protein 5A-like [Denticeps clupeoides]|uniref:von Willebrand factor A domain-containing protein 5A-like n=1 Tax=Denticeps clupeoides TaxID=299321 RepID=UPI0010A38946|nr:von Willebrand factor A domain-containing protein 5A-like [Denticeps clupeoides]
MVNCCGLVTAKNEPVPLKGVEVEVHVKGHVATVTSTLKYVNEEQSPIEAVFVFPLPGDAAVCHFGAKIGDAEVVAELQDKEKAREQYDDALSSGHQAFLLEESDKSPDVFRMNVGSLRPGESAAVSLVYIIELTVEADHALRFCLPAVLNPRYAPPETRRADVPQVTSVPAATVPYTLSLKVHLSSPQPITKVESKCPLEPLTFLNAEKTLAEASLSSGHKFNQDVELLFYYQDAHQPTAIVEAGSAKAEPGSLMGDPVVLLSLYPEFPASVTSSLATCGEFILVVDRSGSMDCTMHGGSGAQMRIDSARDTLLLLLKSLPMGCYFNIYGFGSHYESFFPKSVQYDQKTMDAALKKVQEMKADMGGTEILQPLKDIYSQPCLPGHPRQVFIFTDGEVWNTKLVLDLVKSNAHSHRCFSFGIGEGASTALITGMAREGSGHAQFITGTERMQPKVMQSLRYALQPAVKDISIMWNLPEGLSVTTLSPPLNVIFQGQRALLYGHLKGQNSSDSEGSVTVKYNLAEQSVSNKLSFSLKPAGDTGLSLHRLGARALLRSMEQEGGIGGPEQEGLKEKVLHLSLQSGVISSFTSFIGVLKGSGKAVQGPLLHRDVPTGHMMRMSCPMPQVAYGCAPRSMKGGAMLRGCRLQAMPMMDACLVQSNHKSGFLVDVDMASVEREAQIDAEPQKDLLLQLIGLQKASGSWELDSSLITVFEKTEEEVAKQTPSQADRAVFATILALIWLHGFKTEAQEEWEFLAMKASAWIRAQKVDYVPQCVQAGNALLGCEVQQEALGL